MNLLAYVHLRNIHGSTGAGRTARQLVEHLAGRPEIELEVLADAADARRVLPLVGEPWTSYRMHTFARETSSQQARWFLTGAPVAESFAPACDVVWCTAESYVPTRRAKLAVTAHDAGYFDNDAHRRDLAFWKTRLKWSLLFRRLERKVDLFHTVSQFSADRLAHHFPAIRGRLRVVHNGVTPHFFQPVPEEGTEFLRQAELLDRPFILIPGGLHFRKNADLILEAAPALLRRFAGVPIVVVNHTNAAYAQRAQGLGLRLLGFVADEALHALYAAASVVWFPSRYEGFGLPVVEAMACGAPVVASNSASIPEIAGDAAMLAGPADAAAHVEALSCLLTDSSAREEFAARGRRRAAQFTWDRAAAELSQHLRSLL